MNWIAIGILAGSLVTSAHENREACEGRVVILREQKVTAARCVDMYQNNPQPIFYEIDPPTIFYGIER